MSESAGKIVHDQIKKIETEYDVKNIRYGNEPLWPYIRINLYFALFDKNLDTADTSKEKKHSSFADILKRTDKCIRETSFSLFFREKHSIIFTDTSETKYYRNEYIDKMVDSIIENEKNFTPIVITDRKNTCAFDKYISFDWTYIEVVLRSKFVRYRKKELYGEDIYQQLMMDLGLECTSLREMVINILATKKYFSSVYKRIKPAKVFIVCYYDLYKMAAIKAAKEMGITTVELQHGVINNEHMAYNMFTDIRDNPYPDYLFCFGEKYAENVSEYIYPSEKIKIVGSCYIDLMKKNSEENKRLFCAKYSNILGKIIVTFAAQAPIDEATLKVMRELAVKYMDVFVIYIPRPFEEYHENIDTDNFVVESDLDVYQCMQNSSCTMTVYSTCAMESLCFGTPVLLYNYNHMAEGTYDFMGQSNCNFIQMADNVDDIKKKLDVIITTDKEKIEKYGNQFYADNHRLRVSKALNEI